MGTGDKKWLTCNSIVRKRSRSKSREAAQMVAKPGPTARKVLLCICDKKLRSKEDCENRLLDFFANKGQDFSDRGIMKLPSK
ncbi:hypothetical protein TNCV_1228741 [Trichonephila clavipes]|nr:hypothetical protein TNCV_1228741 [Trichonephila clavipes]